MNILINQIPSYESFSTVFVDVETDEKDNMVGIGYTIDGIKYYYCTGITDELKQLFSKVYLIGHNLKFDAHLLKKWGFDIKSDTLIGDTMLISYCLFGSSRSHALKTLAGELLQMYWSTYEEMTTKEVKTVVYRKFETWKDEAGKRHRRKFDPPKPVETVKQVKVTLDQVEVDAVANYCCHDVAATYKLYQVLLPQLIGPSLDVYTNIELPTMRVLFDMENRGINLDCDKLKLLDQKVQKQLADTILACEKYAPGINIGSSKQLAPVLESMGFWLPTTQAGNQSTKRSVLELHKGHPFIDALLEHSMLKKLASSFTGPLSELDTLPRVYPTFNQVRNKDGEMAGISTGRLSCSNPNLQQIPSKSELAKEIRQLFIPDEGKVLIVGDFSQIEPRILAHLSKDWYLQDVFNTNTDMYLALIKGTAWESKENGRDIGKTFYLALSYGAQAKKLAKVFKCSVDEAMRLMEQCWENIPQVKEWQMKTVAEARKTGYVETMYGRKRFLPELESEDFFIRSSAERQAINMPVQGTAADIMKKATIHLAKAGYPIQLVVHDEVIMSVDEDMAEFAIDDVKQIMENVVKLDVPLKVSIASGRNWDQAKG
jgi:DNA polymerase-1